MSKIGLYHQIPRNVTGFLTKKHVFITFSVQNADVRIKINPFLCPAQYLEMLQELFDFEDLQPWPYENHNFGLEKAQNDDFTTK